MDDDKTNTPLTGAIRRDERGRALERIPGGAPIITPASARSMAEKRWAKYRREAADRITREAAAIDPSVTTPSGAWGLVVSKQYTALMDSDKPRFDDVHRLGQIIGALPGEQDKGQAQDGTIHHVFSLDSSQAQAIAALIADMRSVSGQLTNIISTDGVVDGQVTGDSAGAQGTGETGGQSGAGDDGGGG